MTADPLHLTVSTAEWLRSRTDGELTELLASRPDLMAPAPADFGALARRVDSAATLRRAIAGLDAFELQVLQAMWLLGAGAPDPGGAHTGVAHTRPVAGAPAPAAPAPAAPAPAAPAPAAPAPAAPAPAAAAPAGPAAIAALLGGPADAIDVAGRLGGLHTRGLVRLAGAGYLLAPGAAEALGSFPAGLGRSCGLNRGEIDGLLSALDPAETALVQRLSGGSPIGSVEPESPHRTRIASLIDRGILHRRGDDTVELPREFALALRGPQPLGPAEPEAPALQTEKLADGTIDGAASGRALTVHAEILRMLGAMGGGETAALKTGGIGTVALRALAKDCGIEVPQVALYLEIAYAAGLIAPALNRPGVDGRGRPSIDGRGRPSIDGRGRSGASGRGASRDSRRDPDAVWLPTPTADTFESGSESGGWALVASAWLDLRRDCASIGGRDGAGKTIGVLSAQADWPAGPAQRRRVLRELAAIAPDRSASEPGLAARLAYASPLAAADALGELAHRVLTEATTLGIVAFGGLTSAGRLLLDGDIEGAGAALEHVLPAPIDTVLVQADMTIVAPGRLVPHLAGALAEFADIESAGSATVYRISEASVRRALDSGATRGELQELLARHSATEIPQSVTYLIDDVARRHGVLRAGSVGSVVHSDDPALVRQAMAAAASAGLRLRLLAPTVAVGGVDLETLIEALRAAGLAPTAEGADGEVLHLRPTQARARAASARTPYHDPAPPSAEKLDAIVRRLRASDRTASTGVTEPGDLVALLVNAARSSQTVWIDYADAQGTRSTRSVEPLVVSGGTMVAFDPLRSAPRTFQLSRIRSAHTA